MWLSNFFQLAFMAAIFSTQAIAGNKRVSLPSDLGIRISPGRYPGQISATSNEGFYGRFYVTEGLESIQINQLDNLRNTFKSHEAVLSVWRDQSKLPLQSFEYIVHYQISDSDSSNIDEALKLYGHDPSVEHPIYTIIVSRDSLADTEAWNHLITASFAKDAEEICEEYEEMSDRYIESFRIGINCDSERWVSIDFGRKGDQDIENTSQQ
ncbi:hypothetical protein HOO65_060314 [Ceratocystis lukuohia]|uniref:Uncharacterized protein n=1 Tax=Ceratocystis lukuohia TaxID=2019550 RepID=A0ABR4MDY2_9PEZI